MNMLAFWKEISIDLVTLQFFICNKVEIEATIRISTLFLIPRISTFLPSLLKFQIEIKGEYRRVFLVKMIEVTDLVVLHLFQMLSGTLAIWLSQFFHERRLIGRHLLQYFIDILLYGK